jgi:integrase/recombinase XerD
MNNTFKKYLEAKDLSKSTITHYNSYLMDFLAWLDIDNTEAENATAKEVTAYLNHLKKKGQDNTTRNIRLNVIRQFFNYQIQQGQRENNPIQHLKIRGAKRKKLYPVLSIKELESLYHNYEIPKEEDPRQNRNWYAKYKLTRQRNKVILGLMIWQGLTTPEVNHLKTTDLKLREGTIYIAGSRKSNERILDLKPQQIIELMEYQHSTRAELLKYCKEQSDSLFIGAPSAGKNTATGNDTENAWKALSKEVKKICPRFINFKQVRTSVITHWIGQYNLRQVQYMAGHRYVSTTEGYQLNNMEDLQEEIGKYHPIQ